MTAIINFLEKYFDTFVLASTILMSAITFVLLVMIIVYKARIAFSRFHQEGLERLKRSAMSESITAAQKGL